MFKVTRVSITPHQPNLSLLHKALRLALLTGSSSLGTRNKPVVHVTLSPKGQNCSLKYL